MSKTKERKIHDPTAAPSREMRREWVELGDGTSVCCWELTLGEIMHLAKMSALPEEAGGGVDETASAFWQVMLSARTGDAAGAARVWTDQYLTQAMALPGQDFRRLMLAVGRVNGTDAEGGQKLADFTGAVRAASPSL